MSNVSRRRLLAGLVSVVAIAAVAMPVSLQAPAAHPASAGSDDLSAKFEAWRASRGFVINDSPRG